MIQLIVSILMLSIIAMLLLGMNRIVNGDKSMTSGESDKYRKELKRSTQVISVRSVFSQLLLRKK
ncbi:MAG: hypothetical protein K2M03_07800 [Muribaculaceae bacterium]|nr:hypothetical protein [Muribaculaceae bacterium]